MANIFSLGLAKELVARAVIITVIYSIISYIVIQKDSPTPEQLAIAIPLLFATFGIVMLISILFCLRKYHVMHLK